MLKLIKKSYFSLSNSEKKYIFLLSGLVLFLTLLPTFFALVISGDNYFTGQSVSISTDRMVYLSQMEEARGGGILSRNLFSNESPDSKIFSPLWLALGKIAKFTGASGLLVYHLSRIIFGFIFLLLIYLFSANFIKEIFWRRLTLAIIALASGIGSWIPESNTFMTLYNSPLFILSQIIILLFFWWLIANIHRAKFLEVIGQGALLLILGIIHPYDLVTIFAVSAIWWLIYCWQQKKIALAVFLKLTSIFIISLPSILYFIWLRNYDVGFAVWAEQNITLSPNFFTYASGFGLLFIFYVVGIYQAAKSKNSYWSFLAIWSIVSWFLIFLPFDFQRRLVNGLHLPLSWIAVGGFILLIDYLRKKNKLQILTQSKLSKIFLIGLAGCLLLVNNFSLLAIDLLLYRQKDVPFFISGADYRAISWLKYNLANGDDILASPLIGDIIPAIAARKVFIGHKHQTRNFWQKNYEVKDWFYKTNTHDDAKLIWLQKEEIDFVYFGPVEKNFGAYQPDQKNYLEEVYHNDTVAIYKVLYPQ